MGMGLKRFGLYKGNRMSLYADICLHYLINYYCNGQVIMLTKYDKILILIIYIFLWILMYLKIS